MKKLLPIVVLAATIGPQAQSATVTEQQARAIATQFVNTPTRHMPATSNATLALAHQALSPRGEVDYYVFDRGEQAGFVVVSGDDRTMPVLAYSDQGDFNPSAMPDDVRWWMAQYQRQLQVLREHPEAARKPQKVATSVAPLMTSTWKQSAPYNEEIPSSRFSLGTRKPMVGCVALAMAQVMRKHQWPTMGEGANSYKWLCTNGNETATTETTYSANFGTTTYQWASMRDSYSSSATATAVATLCYHCGVAVNMQYGVQASGAQIYDAATALKKFFRYDKGLDLYLRDFYPADEWDDMLRADLDQALPIIYGGSTQETEYAPPSGHCFVIDGYDTNGMFHINWGWGGDYDGYFATSLLDSGRSNCNFTNWQQAILGARPDRDGTSTDVARPLTGYMIGFDMTVQQAAAGSDAPFVMEGVTFLGQGDFTSPWWGIQILTEDESTVVDAQYIVDATGTEIGATYSADDEAALTVPAGLAEGTYHIRAVYSLDQDATRPYFVRPASKPSYIKMEVRGGVAYFSPGDTDEPGTAIIGDVNSDGNVDVADINAIVNIMLGTAQASDYPGRADVNNDNKVDVADINTIVNLMLGV